MIDHKFEELQTNADRICDGLSKIGYTPVAAVMDIIDNSVSAGASLIEVEFLLRDGHAINTPGSIDMIKIRDNGIGMSATQLASSLQIGSLANYSENSLSKFGLGLKSAGFSLGRRILVASKREESQIEARYVDRDVILERGVYGLCGSKADHDDEQWLMLSGHGTVVSLSKMGVKLESAARVRKELMRKIGVTYVGYLRDKFKPLIIQVRFRGECEVIQGVDILFWEDALDHFNPDTYDGTSACQVYEGNLSSDLVDKWPQPIEVKMVIYPMDKMKHAEWLSLAEKNRVSSYMTSRENSGFFFYRNGRLIRWGDRIAGLQRDDIGFRATVSFATIHDELLHVDVSKQKLELNEEFENLLGKLVREPLAQSRLAFEIRNKVLNIGSGKEGRDFNKRFFEVEETDVSGELNSRTLPERARRSGQLRSILAEAQFQQKGDDGKPALTSKESYSFERVRYTDRIVGLDFAVPGVDRLDGTFVRINRNHPFYRSVVERFGASERARLAIEALLWSSAVAEIKTNENVTNVPFEQIREVFEHFRGVVSQMLSAWVSSNVDALGTKR